MGSGLPIGSEEYKPYVCDPAKAIATFGDVDFINCGGQLLVPGVEEGDEPYLEVIECPTDDEASGGGWKPDATWTIYRVEPEQKKLVEVDRKVYMVSVHYEVAWPYPVARYDEWFHKYLQFVADSEGSTMQDLRDAFCSDDPAERAQGYISLAGYLGWYELDCYPLTLTQHEVHLRYGMRDECACSRCCEGG